MDAAGANWDGRRRELGRVTGVIAADLAAVSRGSALADRKIAVRNMLRG